MDTCNATSRIIANGTGNPFAGNPAIFVNPQAVVVAHAQLGSTLRMGRTNDVTVMINGTDEQQREYIEGIIIAALLAFVFFILWMTTIIIFKCCGHDRVGFFSGQRIRRPIPPTPPHHEMGKFANEMDWADETDEQKANRILRAYQESNGELFLQETQETPFEANSYNQQRQQYMQHQKVNGTTSNGNAAASPAVVEYCDAVEEWQRQVVRAELVQRRVRSVVIFCCLAVITSAILMVTYGVGALQQSVGDVKRGLQQTSDLATTAQTLIAEFAAGQDAAINATEFMLTDVNGICPPLREQLCDDILTATNCDFSGIPFEQEIQTVVDYYAGVQDLVYDELEGFQKDLQEVIDLTAEIDAQVGNFQWAFYVASAFAITVAVLSFFILIGVVMAWNEKLDGSCFRWIRNLVVVPVYVLLVFLSLLFSCIFIAGSLTTADVCYNSPDNVVLQVLESKQDDFSTVLYNFLVFYVGGCPENTVPLPIDDEVNKFLQYLDVVAAFLQDLQADQALEGTCGTNKGILISGIQVVVAVICVVTITILDLRDFLNCDNWNSLYAVSIVY
jgi:hypothetical protein